MLPNWISGTWENQNYCCDIQFIPPPAKLPFSPLEYFKKFIDSDMIKNISYQTNLYSTQKSGFSMNTNETEIEQFIGIHLIMSIIKLPSYKMFWNQYLRQPIVADNMSRNRFDKLRSNIHFVDNTLCLPSNHPLHDKLFKVRPFIESIKNNFKLIDLEEHLCVDEIIIPFKGRSTMKQYNKAKPHKWGIKVFALASKSGFVHDFEFYVGKGTIKSKSTLGLSGDIIIRLCDIIPRNKNYKLCFDNWFTSYQLMCNLKHFGILANGTVRINRMSGCQFKSDKELKKEGRGTYDSKIDTNSGIVGCKWFDNKFVHLFSNYIGPEPTDEVQRWSTTSKTRIPVQRPAVVKEYNSFMGGVDLHDMLVEIYRIDIRSKRFYLRIIFHLIDMAIVNSWILYRRHCKQLGIKKFDPLVNFKSDIAHALILSGKNKVKKRGKPSSSNSTTPPQKKYKTSTRPVNDIRFDCYEHWPEHINNKQRCKHCIKAYSRTWCSKCKLALCYTGPRNCFKDYHQK